MGHLRSWITWGYWLFMTWTCAHGILVPAMVQRKSSGVQTWSHLPEETDNERFSFSSAGSRSNRQIFDFDKELPIHSANLIALPSKVEPPTSHDSQFDFAHSELSTNQGTKSQSDLELPFFLEYLPPPPSQPTLDYLPPSLDYLPPSLDYLPPVPPATGDSNVPSVAVPDSVDQTSRNVQEILIPPSLDYLPPLSSAASDATVTRLKPVAVSDSVDQISSKLQEIVPLPSLEYLPPLPPAANASNIPSSNPVPAPDSVDQTSRNLQEILSLQDLGDKHHPTPPVYFTPPTTAEIHIPAIPVPPVYFTPPDKEFLPDQPSKQELTVQIRWPDPLPTNTEVPVIQEIFQIQELFTSQPFPFSQEIASTPRFDVSTSPRSQPLVRNPNTHSSSWNGVDPCTHAFHRWLCEGTKPRPKVAQLQTTQFTTTATPSPPPAPTTTPQPPLPEIQNPPAATTIEQATIVPIIRVPLLTTEVKPPVVSGWQGMDPCTHAFHRWLCDANRPKSQPATTIAAPATLRNPVPTTPASIRQEIVLRLPEASELQPQNLAPAIRTPISSTPRSTSAEAWSGADPCTHAFHAHLCRQANQSNTPGARIAPLSPLAASSANPSVIIPPPVITTPQPLILPPPPPPVILAFMPPPFLNAPTTPNPHEANDPRYHAFHVHSYQNDKPQGPLQSLANSASNTNSVSILPDVPREAFGAEGQQGQTRSEKSNHGSWVFPSTDPCSHFLHAWLCKPANPSPSRRSWHHRMARHDPFLSAVTDSDEAAMVLDSVNFEAQRIRRRHAT